MQHLNVNSALLDIGVSATSEDPSLVGVACTG
jgi:hypothetical protein